MTTDQIGKTLTAALLLAGFLSLLGAVVTPAQQPARPRPQVEYQPPSGYVPGIIQVGRDVPDADRICVEPKEIGRPVDCRTIQDLRLWVQERKGR